MTALTWVYASVTALVPALLKRPLQSIFLSCVVCLAMGERIGMNVLAIHRTYCCSNVCRIRSSTGSMLV